MNGGASYDAEELMLMSFIVVNKKYFLIVDTDLVLIVEGYLN